MSTILIWRFDELICDVIHKWRHTYKSIPRSSHLGMSHIHLCRLTWRYKKLDPLYYLTSFIDVPSWKLAVRWLVVLKICIFPFNVTSFTDDPYEHTKRSISICFQNKGLSNFPKRQSYETEYLSFIVLGRSYKKEWKNSSL